MPDLVLPLFKLPCASFNWLFFVISYFLDFFFLRHLDPLSFQLHLSPTLHFTFHDNNTNSVFKVATCEHAGMILAAGGENEFYDPTKDITDACTECTACPDLSLI